MKKAFTKKALFILMALGLTFISCTDKAPVKEQQSDTPTATADNNLIVAADQNLKAHQEDIQSLWELTIGESKKMAKYALVKDYVFLSTEDGKDGLLLSFYKDMKDIDNFDGIAVHEGQELIFQGDVLMVKEKTDAGDKTTYFEKTEREGFSELFSVTEKDGKKTYTDDLDEPYDEKEAQDFIDKASKDKVSPLTDNLSTWNNL